MKVLICTLFVLLVVCSEAAPIKEGGIGEKISYLPPTRVTFVNGLEGRERSGQVARGMVRVGHT